MADWLYLSYWLRGFTEHNMLRQFEQMLRKFPFSRLWPRAQLRVYALEQAEPPIMEKEFAGPLELEAVVKAASEFRNADCAYLLEAAWDIWQFEQEWKLHPSNVIFSCYGPLFPSEFGEQLRIELGLETHFLPQAQLPGSLTTVRHNIRSLLHLVRDLDACLPVEKRKLWSESGENFAERLQASLAGDSGELQA